MELNVTRHGDIPVFRLKGRLSVVGADELEKQIVQAIDAGAKRLLFVFDDLDYISSAGLRVFYVGIKKLLARSGQASLSELLDAETSSIAVAAESPAGRVGVNALGERRRADFAGV